MDYETWIETYKPIQNHLSKYEASFDGTMFETYGDEVEFVKTQVEAQKVWTIRDGEDDNLILTAGMGWVNRLGYLITEVPWTDADLYEVVEF